MPSVIGLDIGSSAVRAAEVDSSGKHPTLRRFAEVPLPHGAVGAGRIMDATAVVAALRQLWADGKFSSRRVVVGLSSQAVVVRQVDIPAVPDAEVDSAVRFQAQDLLPFPVQEALLSAQVIERHIEDRDSTTADTMRILLAAAQRDTVSAHLAVIKEASLQVVAVDVDAVALLRALPTLPADPDVRDIDAVVAVGADLTTIAVRDGGTPRFVRVLSGGGASLTEAIASDLGVDWQRAEDLKRQAGQDHEVGGSQAAVLAEVRNIIAGSVDPLVDAIAGSLDFYRAQNRIPRFRRIWLTGGSVLAPGLVDQLRAVLGDAVEIADPGSWSAGSARHLDPALLATAGPMLLTPLGLAVWNRQLNQISLLPEEIVLARRRRRHVAVAAASVALVTAALGSAFVVRNMHVHRVSTEATSAQASLAPLQSEIRSIQAKTTVKAQVAGYQSEVRSVLADDVDWVRLLGQVAAEMPRDVALSSFSGAVTQTAASPGGSATIGTVNVAATAEGKLSVASWLADLRQLPALSGTWVSNVTSAGPTGSASKQTGFESSASLTPSALSSRHDRAQETP